VTSFPPFASNDTLLEVQSSVAATRNRVKNVSEIRFSLRRRSEQRLPFSRVPRRANRAKVGKRAPQLLVGFGATPLFGELRGGVHARPVKPTRSANRTVTIFLSARAAWVGAVSAMPHSEQNFAAGSFA
jgi:hypothetical protein